MAVPSRSSRSMARRWAPVRDTSRTRWMLDQVRGSMWFGLPADPASGCFIAIFPIIRRTTMLTAREVVDWWWLSTWRRERRSVKSVARERFRISALDLDHPNARQRVYSLHSRGRALRTSVLREVDVGDSSSCSIASPAIFHNGAWANRHRLNILDRDGRCQTVPD